MSKPPYSDKDVLKMLNMDSFRNLSKDKAVALANMRTDVKPSTLNKAIEQMPSPALVEFGATVVSAYSQVVSKAQSDNAASNQAVIDACNQVLNAYTKKLETDDLTPEEEKDLIDAITTVLNIMQEQDRANKKYNLEVLKTVGSTLLYIAGAIGGMFYAANMLLGGNHEDNQSDASDEDDDHDVIYSDDEDDEDN